MERDEIKLECLKLAHHLTRPIEEVLGRAKKYEEYLLGPSEKISSVAVPERKRPGRPRKKTENADILS